MMIYILLHQYIHLQLLHSILLLYVHYILYHEHIYKISPFFPILNFYYFYLLNFLLYLMAQINNLKVNLIMCECNFLAMLILLFLLLIFFYFVFLKSNLILYLLLFQLNLLFLNLKMMLIKGKSNNFILFIF